MRAHSIDELGRLAWHDPQALWALVEFLGEASRADYTRGVEQVRTIDRRITDRVLLAGLRAEWRVSYNILTLVSFKALLVIALSDSDPDLRNEGLAQLSMREPRVALWVALGALRDPDPSVRNQAALTLGEVGDHEPRIAVAALLRVFREPVELEGRLLELGDVRVRDHNWSRDCAAYGLGLMGPAAREAVPELRACLRDEPDEGLRDTIQVALRRIQKH